MNKKIYSLLIIFFTFSKIVAQGWVAQTSGTTTDFESVYFVNTSIGWAVGEYKIFKTSNGGINWNEQWSSTGWMIESVFFINQYTGWAAGWNGTIQKTTDGGGNWISQSSGTSFRLNSIYFIDSNIGYAVGENGTILKTTNGGVNWVIQSFSSGAELESVFFVNQNVGWVAGQLAVWKTTDGGLNWISQGDIGYFKSIHFSDSNFGWVVGSSGSIRKTTDGGESWISQTSGTNNTLYSVFFIDENIGWVVGDAGIILKTTNGGLNWLNSVSGTTQRLTSVNFPLGSTGWTVGYNGTILKYSLAGSITVTSPNGGENWIVGSSHNITWTSTNVTNVNIEYTTNNGTSWINIISSTPSDGSYSWTIPNTPSTQCKVRISDATNASINDVSNNVFSIVVPTITVTAPNGGEDWIVSSTQNITWTSSNVTNVKIEYTTNNGTSWINIVSSTFSDGSYSWTIPNTPSAQCKVKITSTINSSINDISDNTFTISTAATPTVTVTSPNGGEDWLTGLVQSITWVSSNVTDVKLEYTTDDGGSWIEIISSTPASGGSYSWTVPNTPSTQSRVRVSDVTNGNINDLSDNTFTISTPVVPIVAVTSPNGGESWIEGSSHNITWTSSNVNNVKIEYTLDDGLSWTETVSSTPASNGSYSWTVPNALSTQCRVKVTDLDNPSVFDASDNLFNIIFSYPATVTINNSVTFGGITNASNYRMVGLPGETNFSVSQGLTGEHPYDWNVYWDNGAADNYQIQYNGTSTFNFIPGKAFWLLSANPFSINQQVNSVQLLGDFIYAVQLHNGWNLISNPFERSVTWSEVQSQNSLAQNQVLYFWNGSWSNPSTMIPYEGYYFNNSGNLTSLNIPYDPNGSLGKESLQKITTEDDYPIDISGMLCLKLFRGSDLAGTNIFIGLNPESKEEYDETDYYCAPGDFQEVRLSLVRKELPPRDKYFYIEQRPEIGEGQEYNLEIKSIPNQEVRLSAEGLENFEGYEVYLLDSRLNNLYNLREKRELELVFAHQINDMKLLIGKSEYIESKKNELQPLSYQLYQNYPNPFNPKTVIRFSLPEKQSVTLTVYSILGELVTSLIDNQDYEAGSYEVEFDGSELSSGVYLYRLNTSEFVNTKKLILLR